MFYLSRGAKLFYRAFGAGPDVVMLHPTPVHHAFWMPVASQLSERYRVILPDLRGHGESETGGEGVSMEVLGEDIECLLDSLGVEHAIFAGCSIGAYTLYELWRRIPQRMDALALCCGKPQPDTAAGGAKRMDTIEKAKLNGPGPFYDQTVNALVGATSRQREPDKAKELRAMMDAMRPQALIAIQQCLADRPDSVPTLPGITVPVLALAGGEDPVSTPEEMRIIPELISGAAYRILPDAGHYAPYEQPQVVGGILGRFFETVSI